jgi:DNA-binding transcriptional regulator LsrR (DeoR family)
MNKLQKTTPKELGPRAKEIVEYVFAHSDLKQKQIAAHFGISEGRLSNLLRSKRVLECFPILARRRLKSLVPKAMDRMERLLEQTDNLEVSRKVTESVLNHSKVLETQPTVTVNVISSMPTSELARLLEQKPVIPSNVVDAELVDDMAKNMDTPNQ